MTKWSSEEMDRFKAERRLADAAPGMLSALRPFVDLLDNYERVCGERDELIQWSKFLDEYSWPTEQDCINARIAVAKAEKP